MDYTWQYYDVVLGAIFVSMAVGIGLGVLTPLALTSTVPVAGGIAIAFMGHGLFVNGPVDAPSDLTDEIDVLN
ncbi:hypothetical protein VB773_13545 [Haloarculaceae archaeon H-GB2-1]|nr:hypothetical protein [Haloarculaceae archaeon H-GB1-1]MEA5386987.1 hypothetical protein [Haloarculaceae archaeon H-GB11]MEA5408489.1 hypothetical protein [Haloarculaceae archaeon H-GB2-1]